jgi:gliding motility-associated-like protein
MKICSFNILFCFSFIIAAALSALPTYNLLAQCPTNIDFEQGNFNGWQCWTGTVALTNNKNLITWDASSPGLPVNNRHTMLSATPGNGIDTFGLFPKNCPNGSGHSIKLGNTSVLNEAEGVSYTFTIPPGQNKFTLIYNYAVVFEEPNHNSEEQPRLKITIENLTDGKEIGCSSFSFIPSHDLPGFFVSKNKSETGTDVWCKDWAANSINLNGNAGKTIRIFFTSADCTFGAHFGYAYLDLNTGCDGSFTGSVFCAGDSIVSITTPFGYKDYTWYNKDFSRLLGNGQVLTIKSPPASGDSVKVVLIPYNGYGCVDTLTAVLFDTLKITANAGRDTSVCNQEPVRLGVVGSLQLVYSWSPVIGLDNPDISNPVATLSVNTKYVVTVTTRGGGCKTTDTVNIIPKISDSTIRVTGNTNYCIGIGLYPVLSVNTTDSIQWVKDGIAISGATQKMYTVTESGKYFAQLFRNTCPIPIKTKPISITGDSARTGISYPVKNAVFNFAEQLQARSFGNRVLWSPPLNLDDPKSYAPIFKGINPQLYTIEIKTTAGCITVDTQLVNTYKKIEIYVPTAFTPNDNNINDRLRPLLFGFAKVNYFKIFNRWGKLLFEMKSDLPGWDGKVNNIPQEIQTVVWIIEAVDVDGKLHNKQGSTVLYR